MPGSREIRAVEPDGLGDPLRLLEGYFREGTSVSDEFRAWLRGAMERGDVEVISATEDGAAAGVLTLAFRPSVSLGGSFASVEDLYVEARYRGRGIGAGLLREAERRCRSRGVSYLEVQVEDETVGFYEASGFEEEAVRVVSRSLPVDDRGNAVT